MKAKFLKSIPSVGIYLFIFCVLVVGLYNLQVVQAFSLREDQAISEGNLLADETIDPSTEPSPTITPSQTPTNASTKTPTPTATNRSTITPTPTALEYLRPIIIVNEYSYPKSTITPGEIFTLGLRLQNSGQKTARNILVLFEPGDLLPLETGGVRTITQLGSGESVQINQLLKVSSGLSGVDNASMVVRVSYVDDLSIKFEEIFNLSFAVEVPVYYSPMPTATPEKGPNPQLIITDYRIDQPPLEAGKIFNLELDVINMGGKSARGVTMILGGGSVNYSASGSATNGITGAEGDFFNFAPYNTSNLRFLGDLQPKESLTLICPMIVNTSTKPGVHPFKISFAYSGEEDIEKYLDDQIVTILVRRIPRVEISFYRDPGYFQVGNPGVLPIQVLNLDTDNLQVISMEVLAANGTVTPQVVNIGSIEAGGYFTQDFNFVPEQSAAFEVQFILTYIDDFKQEQQIEKTVELRVEAPPEPQAESTPSDNPQNEQTTSQNTKNSNFLALLWRFLLGLLGLDSGV